MESSTRTQTFYLISLAARIAGFVSLLVYALAVPELFFRHLAAGPARFTLMGVIWLCLMISMVFRFFPSRMESLGCQKEFAKRFRPTGKTPSKKEIRHADRGALWVLLSWAALNGLFFLCRFKGWLDERFLVCLAGFYGVCDIVCILFFCPFQTWMMHNRCCTTCRIYNWDYLMICTPLLGMESFFAVSACILAALLCLRWEITYRRRTERFFASGNAALQCAQCRERLCRYKRAPANPRK